MRADHAARRQSAHVVHARALNLTVVRTSKPASDGDYSSKCAAGRPEPGAPQIKQSRPAPTPGRRAETMDDSLATPPGQTAPTAAAAPPTGPNESLGRSTGWTCPPLIATRAQPDGAPHPAGRADRPPARCAPGGHRKPQQESRRVTPNIPTRPRFRDRSAPVQGSHPKHASRQSLSSAFQPARLRRGRRARAGGRSGFYSPESTPTPHPRQDRPSRIRAEPPDCCRPGRSADAKG